MEELFSHLIEITIVLMASIVFDVLTIIYNVLDFIFGIGVVIGAVLNLIPLLFFIILSLFKMGAEEIESKINKSQLKEENGGELEDIKGKAEKIKKVIRTPKELWNSAMAYAKSATPFWGLTFPWTRKALKEIWSEYVQL